MMNLKKMNQMKNKPSILATPNFFSIYINGKRVKTVFSLSKIQTSETVKKANNQLEELKWGVHGNEAVQKKFDSVLNK